VPVTREILEDYRQRSLEWLSTNPERKARFEQDWNIIPKPARFPFWDAAKVDRTELLWVSSPRLNAPTPTTWRVFDRTGRRMATVITPASFSVKEIGADYIL